MIHPFAILNALPEGAIVLDQAGAVIFVNDAARRLLGAAPLDQAPGVAGWNWANGPATFRHEDRVFEISRSELPGDPPATLLVYSDVSAQIRAEGYGSFLAHEIKVGVGSTRNGIEMLLRGFGGPLSAEQREIMDIAAHALKHALERIEFLDRLIKLDLGFVALSRDWINISEVIREAAEPFMLPQQDPQAPLELPAAEIWLTADRKWLRHVFASLLEVLRFQFPGRAPRRIAAHQEGAEAVITINVAMNASLWPQIDPVRRVIELHGGTLTVAQQADQGTIFTIRLPIDAQA